MKSILRALVLACLFAASFAAEAANTFDATVSWTCTCTNQTGFNVYRKTGSTGVYAVVGQTSSTVMTLTDPGLQPNTTYFYQIGAFNATNEVKGAEASASTGGTVNGGPGAPTIIYIYKP